MQESLPPVSRVTRSKEEARRAYDAMSAWYDLAGFAENKFKHMGLDLLAVQPGERVLEIGYGTGGSLLRLAQAVGDQGSVYGVDLSAGMRAVAEKKLRSANLLRRVILTQGDAAKLPYEEGFFDALFLSFTLELFDTPEIPQVLAQCRRVLKPGGRLGVVAMGKRAQENLMTRLYEWSHRAFPASVDCRPIPTAAFLRQANFEVMQTCQERMYGLPVDIVMARAS